MNPHLYETWKFLSIEFNHTILLLIIYVFSSIKHFSKKVGQYTGYNVLRFKLPHVYILTVNNNKIIVDISLVIDISVLYKFGEYNRRSLLFINLY